MLKNVSGQAIGAQMITAADGTAFTGAVTVSVTGDNGTQATGSVGSGACAHEGNGYHSYAPAQAETNYDHVAYTFTGSGAIPVTIQVFTDRSYDRLGAPSGASIAADIATVDGVADGIQSDLSNGTDGLGAIKTAVDGISGGGSGGVGAALTTTIATLASQTSFTLTAGSADDDAYNGWVALVTDSSTSTQKCLGVVSDYTGSTRTVTLASDPGIFTMAAGDSIDLIPALANGGLTDQAKLDINSEVDTALSDIHLDHLLAADYDPASKPGVSTALLNELVENDGGEARFTVNALEQAPSGTGASAASIRAEMDSNSTQLAAIVADTNELQTDWADGGRLDNILDARAAESTVTALNDLSAAEVNAEVDTAIADASLATAGNLATVDSNVDAIKLKTDAITVSAVGVESDLVGVHGDAFASGTKPFDT